MFEKITCMALRTVKYDDRRSIVTAWSDRLGRVALSVSAGGSREARRRRALTMPFGVFEGVVDVRPGRDIFNIADMRPAVVTSSTATDPAKTLVALFLSEVLDRVLRDGQPDELLAAFLFDSARRLDALRRPAGVANFPIVFLLGLGHFMGIRPDLSDLRPGQVLDLRDGVLRMTPPAHSAFLSPEATSVAALIDRLTYDNSERMHLPRRLRRDVLDVILRYYSLHHVSLEGLKSLSVVSEIF